MHEIGKSRNYIPLLFFQLPNSVQNAFITSIQMSCTVGRKRLGAELMSLMNICNGVTEQSCMKKLQNASKEQDRSSKITFACCRLKRGICHNMKSTCTAYQLLLSFTQMRIIFLQSCVLFMDVTRYNQNEKYSRNSKEY